MKMTYFKKRVQDLKHLLSQQNKIKDRFQALNSREKTIVLSGAVASVLLLFYAFIWSPLDAHLDNLRTQIQADKKTSHLLQTLDLQFRSLEKKQNHLSAKTTAQSLNRVEEDLKQSPFNNQLTQLTQNSANEIFCTFASVDFDSFMAWLVRFSDKHELTVKQASIQRLNNQGLVKVDFILTLET